jgi:hypothetical protein
MRLLKLTLTTSPVFLVEILSLLNKTKRRKLASYSKKAFELSEII